MTELYLGSDPRTTIMGCDNYCVWDCANAIAQTTSTTLEHQLCQGRICSDVCH